MQERLDWTHDNWSLISRVSLDPIANIGDWEAAEEPWLFLAACEEFHQCIILKERHTTSLPVATDATCSGLQILAGLARDKSTASLLMLYHHISHKMRMLLLQKLLSPYIPEKYRDVWDRKCVKRTVMTIPYNAKGLL